jgi:hypothetical protein
MKPTEKTDERQEARVKFLRRTEDGEYREINLASSIPDERQEALVKFLRCTKEGEYTEIAPASMISEARVEQTREEYIYEEDFFCSYS